MEIYVLKCEDNNYYVGSTESYERRIKEHFSARGSAWTKLHPPIEIVMHYSADSRFAEDTETLKQMAEHGIKHVRGGSFSSTRLTKEQVTGLQRQIWHAQNKCIKCGGNDHWAIGCRHVRPSQLVDLDPEPEKIQIEKSNLSFLDEEYASGIEKETSAIGKIRYAVTIVTKLNTSQKKKLKEYLEGLRTTKLKEREELMKAFEPGLVEQFKNLFL